MKSALYQQYKEKVAQDLMKEFGFANIMQVPKLQKVVINVGYGRKTKDKAFIEQVEKTLTQITGQKPLHNKATKSISNFKIREGMEVGASVTLRGDKMYDFLYRLINVALPRVRDFQGLNPKSFDRNGNYCFGIRENISFPEVRVESSEKIHGFDICIATTAENQAQGAALLTKLGLPLRDKK